LLRYFASVGMIVEVGTNTFGVNNVTRALASPKGESYVNILCGRYGFYSVTGLSDLYR
jgi:hypothetical protein